MAWTAPMTAVDGNAFTAAQFNTHVRDNLLETAPGKATAANQYFVATGANAITPRSISSATVSTAETTTSISYTDLATVGPSVTLTTGTRALVILSGGVGNNTAGSYAAMSVNVSGATTTAASDNNALIFRAADLTGAGDARNQCCQVLYLTLTAGSNTFKAEYRAITSGTARFERRTITVIPY